MGRTYKLRGVREGETKGMSTEKKNVHKRCYPYTYKKGKNERRKHQIKTKINGERNRPRSYR